jgi:GNAT superfamily N-acetyltransferase
MADMLVKLYDIRTDHALVAELQQQGITIKRALAPDLRRIVRFVELNDGHWPHESGESWSSECEVAMANHPPSCFIAVQQHAVVGFACYNATAKGFFGPTGVLRESRGQGIGKALLLASLMAMWDEGYGYAVIGWPAPDATAFYEKTVQATVIEGSSPGIYGRMIQG